MNMTANSYRKASLSVLIALFATGAMIVPDTAQADLSVSGDYRLRFEADWDSHKTSGKARDDRNRARIRARVTMICCLLGPVCVVVPIITISLLTSPSLILRTMIQGMLILTLISGFLRPRIRAFGVGPAATVCRFGSKTRCFGMMMPP